MVTLWSRPDCEAVQGISMWIEYTAWLTPGVWRIGLNAINTGAGLGDDPTWYPEFHVASSLTPEVIRIPASDTEVNYGYIQYRVSSEGYYTVRYWWLNDKWDFNEPPRDANIKIMSAFFDKTQGGGAIVSNSGEGKPDGFCYYGDYTTNQVTVVRSPSGNATLSCQFDGLDPISKTEKAKGWLCTINQGGTSETHHSQWVRSPSGTAHVTCQFSGKPVNDAAVSFDGDVYSAQEGNFTTPLSDLPSGRLTGDVVDIGRACNIDPLTGDPAGRIALIERGECTFAEKLTNAMNAGAIGAIVYNSVSGGEEIITMGGVFVPIPGVFVARSTGLSLQAAAPTIVTIAACGRSASCRGAF